MTFSSAVREAIETRSDPAIWVTMQLERYRGAPSPGTARRLMAAQLKEADQIRKEEKEKEKKREWEKEKKRKEAEEKKRKEKEEEDEKQIK